MTKGRGNSYHGYPANHTEQMEVTPGQLYEEPKFLKLGDAEIKTTAEQNRLETSQTTKAEPNQPSDIRRHQRLDSNQSKVEALQLPEEPKTLRLDEAESSLRKMKLKVTSAKDYKKELDKMGRGSKQEEQQQLGSSFPPQPVPPSWSSLTTPRGQRRV